MNGKAGEPVSTGALVCPVCASDLLPALVHDSLGRPRTDTYRCSACSRWWSVAVVPLTSAP